MDVVQFIASKEGLSAVLSAGSTLIAGFGLYFLQGKSKIVWFSPTSTRFELPPPVAGGPNTIVNAGQIFVQNLGRKSASEIQITSVPGAPPAGYAIVPNVVHMTKVGPRNEWIVEIPYLSASESINIQILNGPLIDSVRSKEGQGQLVPVVHQRLIPKWIQNTAGVLAIFGLFAIFYLFWREVFS